MFLAFIIPGALIAYGVILHSSRLEILRGPGPEGEMQMTSESNPDLAMAVGLLAFGLSILFIWAIK